jgi:hypothetical protein
MQIDVSDRGERRESERDAADDNQRNEDETRTHDAAPYNRHSAYMGNAG